ncbi:MAG: hypothetical protein KZQ83_12275 [gamma proteobacterium symbiont of Taylorina sp.]|nr:hypothetical protein [gamma proteobacterium symbiont of Taylorina sp.]
MDDRGAGGHCKILLQAGLEMMTEKWQTHEPPRKPARPVKGHMILLSGKAHKYLRKKIFSTSAWDLYSMWHETTINFTLYLVIAYGL